jgi:rod shape determining protein RodA
MYFVEKTKGFNFFKQFDYSLFLAVVLLSGIGMAVLTSATRVMPGGAKNMIELFPGFEINKIVITQAIGLMIGIVASLVISSIDYKDFRNLGILLYLFGIVLLVLVLIPGIGVEKQGARSWFELPVMGSFQPAEIVKIAFIIFTSIFFERIKDGQKEKKYNKLKLLIYTVLPIGLVLKQPDAGTAMVFMFAFAVMVFICGVPFRYIFITLGTAFASAPFLWMYVLKEHQKKRFYSFLTPEKYAQGDAYNVIKSKIAIGSGQIWGQGLMQGRQTQYEAGVPVKESDFIFSVVGEELGFIGAALILILIFFILLRCIYIARNSRDTYGAFLVVGLTGMMAFHFIENISMSMGLLPVTGIPLPFVSQGGSSMIANYVAVGVILSVSMRRKRVIFNNGQ